MLPTAEFCDILYCDSVEPLLVNSPVLFFENIDSLCYTREQQSLSYRDPGLLQDVGPAKV